MVRYRTFQLRYPDELPLKAIMYMTGECNYGGRVTDDKDRRLNITLLRKYYNERTAFEEDYKFAPFPEYYAPCTKENDIGPGR